MRIALQTEASTSSTPDTTPSKSSGGSFLDILSQGTQNAAPQAKVVGSQSQSDAYTSSHSSSADASAQQPSTPTPSSASTTNSSDTANPTQPKPAGPETPHESKSNDQAQATDSQTPKVAASDSQQSATQNATEFAALAQSSLAALLANNAAASPVSSTSRAPAASSTAPASSKQSGTKDTQNKQDATTATLADITALQQALLTMPQVVPAQDPIPQQGDTAQQSTFPVAPTSASSDGTDAVSSMTKQLPIQPDQVQPAVSDAAAPTSMPQDSATPHVPAGSKFLQEVAAVTAHTAKPASPMSSEHAGAQLTQSAGQDKTQGAAQANTQTAVQTMVQTAAQAANQAAQLVATQSQTADPSSDKAGLKQAAQTQPAQATALASTFFAAAVPQSDDSNPQASVKPVPFKISSTNLGPNINAPAAGTSATTTAAASAVSAAKNAAQDSSSSSSHDGQAGGNSAQSAQTDNTQASTAAVRNDVSAQTFALNAATVHSTTQTAPSSSASDSTPSHAGTARSLPTDQANPLPASSAINTARVIQNMNETEMRVGMRSTEFGDISIRTMVTQQQMQTQISVDHSELVNALAAHIPAVQAKLGAEYGLHASIEVSQGGAGFTNQQQQQSSQQDYKPFTPSMQFDALAPQAETDRLVVSRPVATAIIAEGSRLDIRA